ncbi:MAG: molybdopterin-dependent oxidoreductase [Polyangiaceae bacterium]|jgi:anaerobic selenocysteine-containing dehydrogenase|nr:molybdopterin-dependent oxidoreductase [Polyangiaceae bacterium]
MRSRHVATCTLCEACCGVIVETEGDQAVGVRGDDDDPQSRGYICPKAVGMLELHHDPDRLRTPLVREGSTWREASWAEAFERASTGLAGVRRRHGRDALGIYYGNPTAHNLGLFTLGLALVRALRSRNTYSASSTDQLPQMLVALEMFGHLALMPVPDVDRTDYFLVLGANPLVSNGSIMTAPDMRRRMRAIRERGGKIVVVDPRRTETAELADEHLFVRPGADAWLLLGMLHVIFDERLARLGRLAPRVDGLPALEALARRVPPARAAARSGVPAEAIARLAREFAAAPRATCYGRVGLCTQEHGTLAWWLTQALNAVTGRLDEPGGAMFTTPAVDFIAALRAVGISGGFNRWTSRRRNLPEFAGELPVAALADEIEAPGPGQVRAMLTLAGNPALSAPNGPRLERALPGLEFMVSIDSFLNETTRHAHVILPPTSPLGRSHYDIALNAFAVRNQAKYVPPVLPRLPSERTDWEICAELALGLLVPAPLRPLARRALPRGPEALVDLGLRLGPHGALRGSPRALSLRKLRASPHGLDLGPLEPRLPGLLFTPNKRIALSPTAFVREAERLLESAEAARDGGLVLVGRRQLRNNNSWLHNSHKLVKGPRRCTLLMHPDDARSRGLETGAEVRLRSRTGAVVVTLEVSDEIMPGVVSLPHGFGHTREGTRLSIAQTEAPGASVNDVTDEALLDRLSGNAGFNGVPVEIEATAAAARAVEAAP